MTSYTGKVAVVTGSESGIGAAIALALSKTHSIGLVWYESASNAKSIESKILEGNRHCHVEMIPMDVSKPTEAADALERFVNEKFGGRLDVLVNSAGIARYGTTLEIGLDVFNEVMNVNCIGPFFLMQRAANIMIKHSAPLPTATSTVATLVPTSAVSPTPPSSTPQFPKIITSDGTPTQINLPPFQSPQPVMPTKRLINITSVHAHTPIPNSPAYSAAKAGLANLTSALAVDLARYGITVNAVAPGMVATGMTGYENIDAATVSTPGLCPLGRPGNPAEIAGLVKWLADGEGSSYVTGQSIAVDGGFMKVNPQFYETFGRPGH